MQCFHFLRFALLTPVASLSLLFFDYREVVDDRHSEFPSNIDAANYYSPPILAAGPYPASSPTAVVVVASKYCIAGDLILSFEFELDGDGDGKIDGRAG